MPTSTRHIPALTGLRFLAALHVVVYHLWRYEVWHLPEPLLRIVKAGPASVTLFFVLSGYLLASRYRHPADGDTRKSAASFGLQSYFRARFARVYPVHLLGFLVALPVAWALWQRGDTMPDTGNADFWQSGFWVLSMMQAWHPAHALAVNPPAWSLSVEVFCYLLFPFLLPKIRFSTRWRLGTATFVLWAIALLVSGLLAWVSSQTSDPQQRQMWVHVFKFHPVVRMPEFIFGMLLSEWVRLYPAQAWRNPRWQLVAGALVLMAWMGLIPYALWHNAWLVPTWMWLLGYLSTQPDAGLNRALAHPVLERLGEASYALYILHVPFLYWVAGFGRRRFDEAILERPMVAISCLVVLVLMSRVVYRTLENPCRKWLRGASSTPP